MCNSVEETTAYAKAFVRDVLIARPCKVVLLEGLVGAGKSVFVRSALRTLGITEDIPSPTFSLVNEYDIHVREVSSALAAEIIYHVDLYRVRGNEAFFSLNIAECAHEGLVFIEWAQNFPRSYYPLPYYCISMRMQEAASTEKRIITCAWHND